MSVAYSAAVKITFDKEITNNPEIVTGTEVDTVRTILPNTPYASSEYSATYTAAKAFDTSNSTYWRPLTADTDRWIATDFGVPVTMGAASFYLSSQKPNIFNFYGSNDNETWENLYGGVFTSTSGWQAFNFAVRTYRYWKLEVVSLQSSALYIYEFALFQARNTYSSSGWLVQGYEPSTSPDDVSPDGSLILTTYTIYRITKAENNLSVTLWLDLSNRMRYPQGQVTVTFTGDLRGAGSVGVAPFVVSFTPLNLTPMFHPDIIERVQVTSAVVTADLIGITYTDAYTDEQVEVVGTTITAVLTDVVNLP